MKKFALLLLAVIMVFSLVACSGDNNSTTVACAGCGNENDSQASFCNSCGTALNETTADSTDGQTAETDAPVVTTQAPEQDTTVKVEAPTHVHSFSAATCTAPGKCSCGATSGSALGHNYSPATCTSPSTCKNCGATSGGFGEHSWSPATCQSPKKCRSCGITEGGTSSHNFGLSGVCDSCNEKIVSMRMRIPSIGTFNGYVYLIVTNNTDSPISVPGYVDFNGKLCNTGTSYHTVAPGASVQITYYRAMLVSERYDDKHRDMYLDNNSIGYTVVTWNGTQYYVEYDVNGITTFYRGNVNGPAA